jgi:predicted RecA/RadA family phage recombinase
LKLKRAVALTAAFALALVVSIGFMGGGFAHADPGDPDFLGEAETYAVIASSTITNTGPTVIVGDVALTPGTSITGFPPGTVAGEVNSPPDGTEAAAALAAHNDLVVAFVELEALVPDSDLGPALVDLTGQSLTAGTYRAGSLLLTGELTLTGGVDDVFVFQADSTLTTMAGSRVTLTGAAQACNVYWKVGSSATLNGGGGRYINTLCRLDPGRYVDLRGRQRHDRGSATR